MIKAHRSYIRICAYSGCGEYTENRMVDYCATHQRLKRKEASDNEKQSQKRALHLEKVKEKNKVARKMPSKVSAKRKKDSLLYSIRRRKHLKKYPYCQLKLEGCTEIATQIHHAAGRIGSNLTNQKHFRSTCASCHKQLHDKLSAKEARARGLKI